MTRYLVHGDGFAEIEYADSPAQAIAQFRRGAQDVNPDIDMSQVALVAETDTDNRGWRAEFIHQHQMAFGVTDEFA